jgi:hypothetical protein
LEGENKRKKKLQFRILKNNRFEDCGCDFVRACKIFVVF